MSKVTRKRLRELVKSDGTATSGEVRALVLEVKCMRATIEQFTAAQGPAEPCRRASATISNPHVDTKPDSVAIKLS